MLTDRCPDVREALAKGATQQLLRRGRPKEWGLNAEDVQAASGLEQAAVLPAELGVLTTHRQRCLEQVDLFDEVLVGGLACDAALESLAHELGRGVGHPDSARLDRERALRPAVHNAGLVGEGGGGLGGNVAVPGLPLDNLAEGLACHAEARRDGVEDPEADDGAADGRRQSGRHLRKLVRLQLLELVGEALELSIRSLQRLLEALDLSGVSGLILRLVERVEARPIGLDDLGHLGEDAGHLVDPDHINATARQSGQLRGNGGADSANLTCLTCALNGELALLDRVEQLGDTTARARRTDLIVPAREARCWAPTPPTATTATARRQILLLLLQRRTGTHPGHGTQRRLGSDGGSRLGRDLPAPIGGRFEIVDVDIGASDVSDRPQAWRSSGNRRPLTRAERAEARRHLGGGFAGMQRPSERGAGVSSGSCLLEAPRSRCLMQTSSGQATLADPLLAGESGEGA